MCLVYVYVCVASVAQCSAAWCSALQCVAVCCSCRQAEGGGVCGNVSCVCVLQSVAVLQCIAVCVAAFHRQEEVCVW